MSNREGPEDGPDAQEAPQAPTGGEGQPGATHDHDHTGDHTGRHRHVHVMPGQGTGTTSGYLPGSPDAGNGPTPDGSTPVGPARTHPPVPKEHKVKAELRQEELVRGAHPGDRYIRYGRNVGPFRRKSGGVLAASLEAEVPRTAFGRAFNAFKRVVVGR